MEPNFCRCDCGEIAPDGKRYIRYHHNRDPQKRAKNSKTVMGNKNPFFGKTHSDKTKQLISDINTGRKHSPESKQLMSENHPDVSGKNHPMFGKHHSPKTKQLMSVIQTGRKHSPETRRKISENHADMSGEKHPMFGKRGIGTSNWQGGISKEPYCFEFTQWLKKQIKKRDGFECKNPDCTDEITKNNPLCIHHINYVKKDCSANNLITICRSCNNRANFNREHWTNFYNKISKTNIS